MDLTRRLITTGPEDQVGETYKLPFINNQFGQFSWQFAISDTRFVYFDFRMIISIIYNENTNTTTAIKLDLVGNDEIERIYQNPKFPNKFVYITDNNYIKLITITDVITVTGSVYLIGSSVLSDVVFHNSGTCFTVPGNNNIYLFDIVGLELNLTTTYNITDTPQAPIYGKASIISSNTNEVVMGFHANVGADSCLQAYRYKFTTTSITYLDYDFAPYQISNNGGLSTSVQGTENLSIALGGLFNFRDMVSASSKSLTFDTFKAFQAITDTKDKTILNWTGGTDVQNMDAMHLPRNIQNIGPIQLCTYQQYNSAGYGDTTGSGTTNVMGIRVNLRNTWLLGRPLLNTTANNQTCTAIHSRNNKYFILMHGNNTDTYVRVYKINNIDPVNHTNFRGYKSPNTASTGSSGLAKRISTDQDLSTGSITIISQGNKLYFAQPFIFDTIRGVDKAMQLHSSNAQTTETDSLKSFNDTGFTIGSNPNVSGNHIPNCYVLTLLARAGFVTIKQYTGTGAVQNISHDHGSIPEMIITKCTSGISDWTIYFNHLGNTKKIIFNTVAANATSATTWNNTTPTDTVFTVGTDSQVNTNAATYISYQISSLDKASKVTSFVSTGASPQVVNFGFRPSWVLIKSNTSATPWVVIFEENGIVQSSDLGSGSFVNESPAPVLFTDTGISINGSNATYNSNGQTYSILAFAK
jgi:hypothetical protein